MIPVLRIRGTCTFVQAPCAVSQLETCVSHLKSSPRTYFSTHYVTLKLKKKKESKKESILVLNFLIWIRSPPKRLLTLGTKEENSIPSKQSTRILHGCIFFVFLFFVPFTRFQTFAVSINV